MKRILSTILTMVMLCSMLSILSVKAETGEIITSGFYEYRILEDGSAEIVKYNGTPNQDGKVKIPNEIDDLWVTSIGDSVFAYRFDIKSVEFPDYLYNIGKYAFENCSFWDLKLPFGIKTIGEGAFKNVRCSSFDLTLNSVETIGESAFEGCDAYFDIRFGDKLREIGRNAFKNVKSIVDLGIFDENPYYTVESGSLYDKNKTTLIIYRPWPQDNEICDIRDTVTKIEEGALVGCSNLREINIPASLTDLGDLESLGMNFANNAPMLSKINVDSANPKFSSIDGVLYDKEGTTLLQYPRGREEKSFEIPGHVKKVNGFAFYNNASLENVTIPNSVQEIGWNAFDGLVSLKKIDIPDSVVELGTGAFQGCANLETVKLPKDLTSIPGGAFSACTALKNITLPAGVKELGLGAFANCNNLSTINGIENIEFADNSALANTAWLLNQPDGLIVVGKSLYGYKGQLPEELVIPDGVKSIGAAALTQSAITTIKIPASVTYIDASAFAGLEKLRNISVDEANANYCVEAGVLFNKDCTELVKFPQGEENLTKYSVGKTVKTIKGEAFYNCKFLTEVYIPNSVTSIEPGAFKGCSENLVLKGVVGGVVEKYAQENGFKYELVEEAPGSSQNKEPTPEDPEEPKPTAKKKLTKPTIKTIKSVAKKTVKITLKKMVSGAKNFEVKIATNKSFKGAKTVKVKAKKVFKVKYKLLKKGKKIWFKVRALKTSKKKASSYSNAKWCKIKK